MTSTKATKSCGCGGELVMSKHCGAFVCEECDHHAGLVRCYCGWSASGGDGYEELLDEGETIEPEDDWN